MVYLGICSLIGSLTVCTHYMVFAYRNQSVGYDYIFLMHWWLFDKQVMSIKAIGISIKLTIEGINQAGYFQTWVFAMVAVSCIVTQLIYLNKVTAWPPVWCF